MGKFNRFCKAISLDGKIPSFVSKELEGYCQDVKHGLTLELDKIRPETQATIANFLRDSLDDPTATLNLGRRASLLDPDAKMGIGIPIPGAKKVLPIGLLKLPSSVDVAIWATNVTDPSKLKVTGVTLRVTVWRW